MPQLVRFPFHPVALATAMALHGLAATAQTGAPTSEATTTLPTVTIRASADASAEGLSKSFSGGQVARGGRVGVLGNQDIMDTPFSMSSYTNQLIQDQQAKSIGDVLLNDASVRSARGFGNFQQTYFIRGFTVFSDDVAYNGLYGLVPRQYMATEFVERVEIFRGANAFLSGAGSGSVGGGGIGGLINVVPKRAPDQDLNQVTFGVQTGGQTLLAADIGRRFGPDRATGLRLNAAHREGGTGIDREKQRLDALAVGLDWHARDVRLSADAGYQANHLSEPRPNVNPTNASGIPDAPDASKNFAQPWTYSQSHDAFATVRGEVDLSNQVTAWGAFGLRDGHEFNRLGNPYLSNPSGATGADRFDNVREEKVKTGEIGIRGKFKAGSFGNTLTASITVFDLKARDAYGTTGGFSNTTFTSSIYVPTAAAMPALTFVDGSLDHPNVSNRLKTSSVSLSDTMSFADTVLLTLGARHQTIKNKTFNYTTGALGEDHDKSRTTPMAGVVLKASKAVSVYGNYIEGLVKGPTISSAGVTRSLDPYVSRQKEVGVKYDGGTIGASLAYFDTSKPSAYGAFGSIGVDGKQQNKGIELSAFGQPIKGLRVLGGLTLLNTELSNTTNGTNGNESVGVPKHQLNLGVDWDVPGVRGLAVNGLLLNTGKQYADAQNTQKVPAWTRVDAGVRYLMDIGGDRTLTLRGRVENLFDKSYWASVGGYPGSGYLVVGQPRTVSLTATIDF